MSGQQRDSDDRPGSDVARLRLRAVGRMVIGPDRIEIANRRRLVVCRSAGGEIGVR
jgi:hypothetical protein